MATTNNPQTTYDFVQAYTGLGFACIPLTKGTKRPALSAWKLYQTKKPTQEQLKEWFLNKDVGVGIVTGEVSNLSIIDSDSYRMGAAQLAMETPLIAQSGNGGRHYYFRNAPNIPAFKNHTLHVELLSKGNIVVAPPTIHPNGKPYVWQSPLIENVNQLPFCSDEVLKYAPIQKENGRFDWKKALNVQQGARDETIYKAASSLAGKKFEFETALAIIRGVNVSYIPPLEDSIVVEKLKNAFAFVESQSNIKNKENTTLRSGRVLPVNDIVNDISKRRALDELRVCKHRTNPARISDLLATIFSGCGTYKEAHWLYIAERWAPRPILRTIGQVQRTVNTENPAALFTFKIRYRKIRRNLRNVLPVNDIFAHGKNTSPIVKSMVAVKDIADKEAEKLTKTRTTNVLPVNDIAEAIKQLDAEKRRLQQSDTAKPKRIHSEHVTYSQLEPWQRYYYVIASRGGEGDYMRRLGLKYRRVSI